MVVKATAIIPDLDKLLDIDIVRAELERQLIREAEAVGKLYEKTISTWNNKPTFNTVKDFGTKELSITISTESDIYRFLHDGTAKRFAIMSKGWVSKTTPQVLSSGPGAGFVVLRGKTVSPPRPGIKAREWTRFIIRDREGKFRVNMEQAVTRGLNKSGAVIP